jgi:hypothetical protein
MRLLPSSQHPSQSDDAILTAGQEEREEEEKIE